MGENKVVDQILAVMHSRDRALLRAAIERVLATFEPPKDAAGQGRNR